MMTNSSRAISAKEEISGLRSEILESQKARIDLLKFKLIAIAALGSVGLGLGEYSKQTGNIDIILCIIPFVCIYIDFLCYHNTMRILVIGQFLAYSDDAYEQYLPELGKNNGKSNGAGYYFELEDFSLEWSSCVISVFVAIYGVYISDANILSFQKICFIAEIIISSTFIFYLLKSKKSGYYKELKIKHKNHPIRFNISYMSFRFKLIIYLALIFLMLSILFYFSFDFNKNFILFLIGEISTICVFLSTYFYDKHKNNLFSTAGKLTKKST